MAGPDPGVRREIDARGLRCPLPVLRAARALRDLPQGGCLRVLCDDPAAPAEFAAFCEATGAVLLEQGEIFEEGGRQGDAGGVFVFLLARGA